MQNSGMCVVYMTYICTIYIAAMARFDRELRAERHLQPSASECGVVRSEEEEDSGSDSGSGTPEGRKGKAV